MPEEAEATTRRVSLILAGGSGDRFWPLSHDGLPKQFLKLSDPDRTMLEEAVARALLLSDPADVYISTSRALRPLVESLDLVPRTQILAEPLKRNTLGAVIWGVAQLISRGYSIEATSLAVLTSDHRIEPASEFAVTAQGALSLAEEQRGFVTIGIQPTRPETGFGYIEIGEQGTTALRFREKPDKSTAETFLSAGGFLWNSGMFFFRLETLVDQLRSDHELLSELTSTLVDALLAGNEAAALALFEAVPDTSFDYAVMEKLAGFECLRATFDWDDLGTWAALDRTNSPDDQGNVVAGAVVAIETKDCVAYNASTSQVVSLLGVSDLIVVATDQAVLVVPKDAAQRVREVAQLVRQIGLGAK